MEEQQGLYQPTYNVGAICDVRNGFAVLCIGLQCPYHQKLQNLRTRNFYSVRLIRRSSAYLPLDVCVCVCACMTVCMKGRVYLFVSYLRKDLS